MNIPRKWYITHFSRSKYNCSNTDNPWQWLKSKKKWPNQLRNLRLNWIWRSAIWACFASWKWRSIFLATRDLELLLLSVLLFHFLWNIKENLSPSRILKIRSLGVETLTYQVTGLVIKTRSRIRTNFVIKVSIENKTNFVIPITELDSMITITSLENCQWKKFNWFLNNVGKQKCLWLASLLDEFEELTLKWTPIIFSSFSLFLSECQKVSGLSSNISDGRYRSA